MGAKRVMQRSPDIRFDVASVLGVGRRDHQEDALATDFPLGAGFGYAVLADGMGGHAAGDVASKIVVTEVFSELKLQSGNRDAFLANTAQILADATNAANNCVKAHSDTNPGAQGMGSTLVATVFIQDKMHWISVGDSRECPSLLCMTDLAHASKLKEHDDNDDFQGTTGRAA